MMEKQMKVHKGRNISLLFLTALIWGAAFVAQSVSMDYIEPQTFIFLRSLIGGLTLVPIIWLFDRSKKDPTAEMKSGMKKATEQSEKKTSWWKDRQLLTGGIICGLCLYGANCFQQTGIQYTTVGKAGFITSFYIIIVPIIGIFLKKKCGALTWIAVVIALVGLYFLCMNESFQIQNGDFLILGSAFLFALHITVVDYFVQSLDGMKMSCIQFFTGAVLGCIGMLLFDEPQLSMIIQAAVPILYTGVMSTGVGYTLQIIGQKGLNPTMAALILSLESVFSALSGFIILHQVLSIRELFGCILMFLAIILAQIPDFHWKAH